MTEPAQTQQTPEAGANVFALAPPTAARTTTCGQCGNAFTPRARSGGKPQKFCSAECRRAADGQRGPTRQPAKTKAPDDDIGWYWFVESQDRIEIGRNEAGGLEIEQTSRLGPEHDQKILVARSNAVRLARSILWAAGFHHVTLAVEVGGGFADLEDGSLPEHFSD